MKKSILAIGIILILATFMLVLTGCEGEKGLVGKWAYGSFVYTFNADKTGTYDMGAATPMKFTYEDRGDKIAITYEGNTEPLVLEYRIEGKALIVKDSFGLEVKYDKK